MSQTTTSVRPRRPLTKSELAARRANAAKSTGPRTPEGKARSSQNAVKHGFFTQTALLYYESPEEFVALRDAYISEYNPQGPTEMHFVMEMANAQYRLRRVRGIEADLIQKLVTRDIVGSGLSNGEIQAEAFRTLADESDALQLLQRYEVMFRRQYERALRLLWEHRDRQRRLASPKPASRRPATSPATSRALQALHALLVSPAPGESGILQNEPEPAPSPTPSIKSRIRPAAPPRPAPAPPPGPRPRRPRSYPPKASSRR